MSNSYRTLETMPTALLTVYIQVCRGFEADMGTEERLGTYLILDLPS